MKPDVKVTIAADGAQVGREVSKVKTELTSLDKTGQALGANLKKIGGIVAGAFTVGAITGWLRTVNQAADRLNDLSAQLGTSASGLQSLQIAAQQAGGSAEGLNTALAKMSVTLGDALAGNKQAAAAFARLGLSAKELSTLKADEAFLRIDAAIGQVSNSFERASIQQDIFGKGYRDIAGLSGAAAAEVARVNAELERQGAALNDLDIAKIGAMNDDLALQGQIVQNLGIKFLGSLSPAIDVAVDSFGNLMSNMGGATEAGKTFGVVMTAAIKMIEAGVYALGAVFEGLRYTVGTILAFITTGVSNLVGGLATVAQAAGLDIGDRLREASNVAGEFATSLNNVAIAARDNAKAAAAAAVQAGLDVFRAEEIFAQASARMEARAAEVAERARQAQGAVGAIGAAAGGSGAKDQAGKLPELTSAKVAVAPLDPMSDPRVLAELNVNAALDAIRDQYAQTTLGKIEAFEQTKIGMMLSSAELQQQIEFSKNATLGDAMSSLVGMAAQQSGSLGKVGKALAIAQTVWSTGTAIMKAMAEVPWPGNLDAAANIAAMGVAQLANIKKTNVGSAGSIVGARGGAVGGTPAALSDNVPGVQAAPLKEQSAVQIIVQGSLFAAQETVDWLTQQIGEAVNGRDLVFIQPTSRQALELRG